MSIETHTFNKYNIYRNKKIRQKSKIVFNVKRIEFYIITKQSIVILEHNSKVTNIEDIFQVLTCAENPQKNAYQK